MSISINQYPASASLAQSPIVFSVNETSTGVLASSSFQYIAELYYWTGSESNSGSADYTLQKYPNTSDYGIFDFSRIINSTLVEKREANPSNVVYFKGDFYYQYVSASQFITSSHVETGVYKALDGYAIFPEEINQQITSKSLFWPVMTDGPVTQSIFGGNLGTFGVYTGDCCNLGVTHLQYSSSLTSSVLAVSSSISSSEQIQQAPYFPSQSEFPITYTNWYEVCPVSQSVSESYVYSYTNVSASFTTLAVTAGDTDFDYYEPSLATNATAFETFFNTIDPMYVWASDGSTPYFTSGSGAYPYAKLRGAGTTISGINIRMENPTWRINAAFDGQTLDMVFSNNSESIENRFISSSITGTTQTDVYAPVGECIRFEETCQKKYPNVRIKWKNRYGQFDYLNFNLVSKESFSTTTRTYQPQLGTWNGTSLTYNQYDSSIENYISDSSQTLTVNSDWLSEDYNDLLKQLMVSDEIYWIYNDNGDIKPLTIKTSNLQFKTAVVDKLIQYSFEFDLGQNYKLIV